MTRPELIEVMARAMKDRASIEPWTDEEWAAFKAHPDSNYPSLTADITAALAAAEAAGFVVVPVEATEAMVDVAVDYAWEAGRSDLRRMWRAMIAPAVTP
jgi:hypothetical protein